MSDLSGVQDAPESPGASTATRQEQPRPRMFGFGRHTCPGSELAKIEILLFFRTFLRKFDYRLVKGQVFRYGFVSARMSFGRPSGLLSCSYVII